MRILFITPSFAPRGTSAAVRIVHLCKYLSRIGHELKVLTYDESVQLLFSPPDPSLAAKVPDDVEVCCIPAGIFHRWTGRAKSRGTDPRGLKKRGTKSLLSSLIIPDPHIAAYRTFKNAGDRIIRSWDPQVILTFSYPFTSILIGAALKRAHPQLTWVADYGDPWTGSPVTELNLPDWRRRLDRRLESRALRHVDLVTVTTEPTARLYEELFPFLTSKTRVITMGYDPDDVLHVNPAGRSEGDQGKQVLVHAGRLYREARDPGPFFSALAELQTQDPTISRRLKVVLLGEVEPAIREEIENSAARDLVEFHGWVTVEESLARMKAADHLLLFGNQGEMQIPGKVYQYMGAGRPVFMTCESEGDPTVDVLKRYGHAAIVPNEETAIMKALRDLLEKSGKSDPTDGCVDFEWSSLARSLADAIQEVQGNTGALPARASS